MHGADGAALHPDHLLTLLTAEQLHDWLDYYAVEPWGSRVEDARALMISRAGAMNEIDEEKYLPHVFAPDPAHEPTPEETIEFMKLLVIYADPDAARKAGLCG